VSACGPRSWPFLSAPRETSFVPSGLAASLLGVASGSFAIVGALRAPAVGCGGAAAGVGADSLRAGCAFDASFAPTVDGLAARRPRLRRFFLR